MRVYLICFELLHPDSVKRRTAIGEAIKKFTGFWWHYCGVWMVAGESITAQELHAKMSQLLKLEGEDTDDSLFIVRVSPKDTQGWLPDTAWKWLKNIESRSSS
jgi:hypothetical protein